MSFEGFTQNDFQIFNIDGLDERMHAIKEFIQPKFRAIGEELTADLSSLLGNEMYLHIAKHARRTVNPPKDTWLAIGPNKRGYKQYPHFQVGLFDDHVFIWLAYIYELPNKARIADNFIKQLKQIEEIIPSDFVVSTDHMHKNAKSITEVSLQQILERFKNVKKAELLIGRNISKDEPLLMNGKEFTNLTRDTFKTLLPIYQMSFSE